MATKKPAKKKTSVKLTELAPKTTAKGGLLATKPATSPILAPAMEAPQLQPPSGNIFSQ